MKPAAWYGLFIVGALILGGGVARSNELPTRGALRTSAGAGAKAKAKAKPRFAANIGKSIKVGTRTSAKKPAKKAVKA